MTFRFERWPARRNGRYGITECIGIILISGFLCGCEKLLGITAPESDSQLAVYGFLNPDDPVAIDLYRTALLNEKVTEEELRLDEALVIVTTSSRRDTLIQTTKGRYARHFSPTQGEHYSFEVQKPGFESVRAECSVPRRPETRVKIEKLEATEFSQRYRITVQLDDPPGEHVYRMGLFEFLEKDNRQNDTPWAALFFSTSNASLRTDPADVGGQPLETSPVDFQVVYFSDDTIESETGEFILNVERGVSESSEVHLVVTSMDSAYFEYHKSLSLQRRNLDDPFAEPVTMFSNIEYGQGIVGCYANRVTSIRFQ